MLLKQLTLKQEVLKKEIHDVSADSITHEQTRMSTSDDNMELTNPSEFGDAGPDLTDDEAEVS